MDLDENGALESRTSMATLATLALFIRLEHIASTSHEVAYAPMTLPLGAEDGMGGRGEDNIPCDTSNKVMSCLLSTAVGRVPQLGGDGIGLPPGFVPGVSYVINTGDSINRCLLTPMTRLFSTDPKVNNYHSRETTVHDLMPTLDSLREMENPRKERQSIDEGGALDCFISIIQCLDQMVDRACMREGEGPYERIYREISTKLFPDEEWEGFLCKGQIRELRAEKEPEKREQAYWLALNCALGKITGVMISPVGDMSDWVGVAMECGGLELDRGDNGCEAELLVPAIRQRRSSRRKGGVIRVFAPRGQGAVGNVAPTQEREWPNTGLRQSGGLCSSGEGSGSESSGEEEWDEDETEVYNDELSRGVRYLARHAWCVMREGARKSSGTFHFCRLYDTIRLCRRVMPMWRELDRGNQLMSITRRLALIDPVEIKYNRIIGGLVCRRSGILHFLLRAVQSDKFDSRNVLTEVIGAAKRVRVDDCLRQMLVVPGSNGLEFGVIRSSSGSNKEECDKRELLPIHTIPFSRPSSRSTVASCRDNTKELQLSQRLSQTRNEDMEEDEDGEEDENGGTGGEAGQERAAERAAECMERNRLVVFSDTGLTSIFFFLDCFVPTEMHARRMERMLKSEKVERSMWTVGNTQELVTFFWDAMRFLSASMKHHYSDPKLCGERVSRRKKQHLWKITRVILFHSVSIWMAELMEEYGQFPVALEGYRPVIQSIVGSDADGRIVSLAVLSVAFRSRSKMPKQLGLGYAAMVQQKIRPLMEDLWSLAVDIIETHNVEREIDWRGESAAAMEARFREGTAPLESPFGRIWESTLEYLPRLVDRQRGDQREMKKGMPASFPNDPGEYIRLQKRRKTGLEQEEDGDDEEEGLDTGEVELGLGTGEGQMMADTTDLEERVHLEERAVHSEVGVQVDKDGRALDSSNKGLKGGGSKCSEELAQDQHRDRHEGRERISVVAGIHKYLDTLVDERYAYSPREVITKIAQFTRYQKIDQLCQTMREMGMDDEDSETEEEDGRKLSLVPARTNADLSSP